MKFAISKASFLKELGFVQGVVDRKNTIPILSNVVVDAKDGEIRLKATDLDISVSTSVPAQVENDGAACLPAKKLFEIVRSLPDSEVVVQAGGGDPARITCGRSKFKMASTARENFPDTPDHPAESTKLPGEMLRTFINRTQFAITTEESRYALNGAKFELSDSGARMIATDGHRLAFIESKVPVNTARKVDVIIPKKSLNEILKLSSEGASEEDSVDFASDDNHLFFAVGKRRVSTRLVSGQFPNYELVLPKENENKVTVSCADVASAIRRVALMSDERSRLVKFDIQQGEMQVRAQAADVGEAGEDVSIEYSGPPILVGFNAQYLVEFFNVVQEGNVFFDFKDGNSQAQLRPSVDGGYDFRYVVMPMRL